MSKVTELLAAIRACSDGERKELFRELRGSNTIHVLEDAWKVRAELILEAIFRSSDLTQRGVRGIIAETVFALDVVPRLKDWKDQTPPGNHSFDVLLVRQSKEVRVQVKMQRKERGKPKVDRSGMYVVEVQKTRSGTKGEEKTRPYRFTDFDLLAVCMEPATGNWKNFMFVPTKSLKPNSINEGVIQTFQPVPAFTEADAGIWTGNLASALERL